MNNTLELYPVCTILSKCCRGAVSKHVGRATAYTSARARRMDGLDLMVVPAVMRGPGLPLRLVRRVVELNGVGVVAGPLGADDLVVFTGVALHDHHIRRCVSARVLAERLGHLHALSHGAVAATRRRDVPDRRVPRAVRCPGLRVAATSGSVRAWQGRMPTCLACRLVRDAVARRARILGGSGGGHETGEREEEETRHLDLT